MAVYHEILNQIQNLSRNEQNLLFEDFKKLLRDSQDIENDFSDEDLAESDSEWQNYAQGNDQGISLQELELELFGGKVE